MSCEQVRDLVPLLAVDLLERDEASSVRRHLEDGCPACAAELAAARRTLDLLPLALPSEAPSPALEARLMAAVRREEPARRAVPSAPAPSPGRSPERSSWRWMAAAGVAGLLLGGLITGTIAGRRASSRAEVLQKEIVRQNEAAELRAGETEKMKSALGEASAALELIGSPDVTIIDLSSQIQGAKGHARIYWDHRRAFWQLYATDLPPLPQNRAYQLWFVTATSKVSAGVFMPSPSGSANLRAQVPSGLRLIVAAAVTVEPSGGSPQPTSRMRLLGQV